MEFLLILAVVTAIVFYRKSVNLQKAAELQAKKSQQEAEIESNRVRNVIETFENKINSLQNEIRSLEPFKGIRDISLEADTIRRTAEDILQAARLEVDRIKDAAQRDADEVRRNANADAKAKRDRVDAILASATKQAELVIRDANVRAEEIAGSAFRAMKDADEIKEIATAMKNVIEGYGDRYLKPTYSLLDELAETFGFEEAGQQLKMARERSKKMVETGQAASCEYVEAVRRTTAVRFVTDAFNGKCDSILSRAKSDNYGTLEQQIRDSYALVNSNGAAFRNAHIREEYLAARIAEFKWSAAVMALRDEEREEQRRIREQIREEEKARREIERALKEAEKDEETLHKAMEKVQAQVAKANDEQRAAFEAKLATLQAQLAEAEARSQRALSMAQQTKAGHVYVISNVGSFGEHIYKVGMTRRLEPLDRIKELGDASVPFEFDIHAMIWSDDAPSLENSLHKQFIRAQVNKVDPRKEFFKLPLMNLKAQVEKMGIEATWTMSAQAAQVP